MPLDILKDNAIIYVLIAWVVTILAAKALKLQNHGFELKPYSLVYKNSNVQTTLTKILGRTRRGIKVFANVSVIAGFLMMGFAFWFLISNIYAYFIQPTGFNEVTVLIPGVTLTSSSAILNFLLSIPIVLVIHEGAHGIVATLERIKIKTGGFAVFIAMFAGFVEPDEKEFDSAKKISKLRVIGAGATANVIFAFALGALLLTNPLFAIILPEPIRGVFYESPDGVMVLSILEGFGAESAGILVGDIIVEINDVKVKNALDMQQIDLAPNDTASVTIQREKEMISFEVDIMTSPDGERGLIGITRDNAAFKPVMDFIEWNNHGLSLFLLWLWMISFFIGIINMLPMPILDGGKFVQILLEDKLSEKSLNVAMWAIYAFTFGLFGLNIALSYIKSGWFTI
ncbi:MAG: peptidase M50 [Cenarchaeum symbiont of Oopsacas minuta]|nr:peptidase M50 [Cenarchaeum symbiont of Oopsacas minuta]